MGRALADSLGLGHRTGNLMGKPLGLALEGRINESSDPHLSVSRLQSTAGCDVPQRSNCPPLPRGRTTTARWGVGHPDPGLCEGPIRHGWRSGRFGLSRQPAAEWNRRQPIVRGAELGRVQGPGPAQRVACRQARLPTRVGSQLWGSTLASMAMRPLALIPVCPQLANRLAEPILTSGSSAVIILD